MIGNQQRKLARLARDIAKNGLSPLENFALVQTTTKPKNNYVSLDGNRRLLALKLLRTPELCTGTDIHAAIKKLAGEAHGGLPAQVTGIVLDRDSAYKWIQRKHDTGLDGIGLEPWSTEAKKRFQAYLGKHSPALSIIDAIRARDDLTTDERDSLIDVPLTTVERVVLGEHFKRSLGLDYVDGKIVGGKDRTAVERVWKRIVLDFASGEKDVNDVRKLAERNKYIDAVIAAETKKRLAPSTPWELASAAAPSSKAGTRKPRLGTQRSTVATLRAHPLAIGDSKAELTYRELTKLKPESHCIAAALTIRLFLELSCIVYQRRCMGFNGQMELQQRLAKVLDHLVASGATTEKEVKGARRAVSDKHDLCSTDTLNAYSHSVHFVPRPTDIMRTWDQLYPFFQKVWA